MSMPPLCAALRTLIVFPLLFVIGTCSRDDAFIGYEEKSNKCEDLKPDCPKWAKNNQCIENAYFMREHCPKVRLAIVSVAACKPFLDLWLMKISC